ncbi:MAG: hypothetical protein WAT19_16800 [Ferruginibacter sp.]
MILFIISPSVVLFLSYQFLVNKEKLSHIPDHKISNLLLISLLVLLAAGFILNLENNEQEGCIVPNEPVFNAKNIFYSLISGILFTAAIISKEKERRLRLLTIELAFWLLKFFYWKGGYAVGIGGIPLFTVVLYDSAALSLRLLLLNHETGLFSKTWVPFLLLVFLFIIKTKFYMQFLI